jgi:hypothetical protein
MKALVALAVAGLLLGVLLAATSDLLRRPSHRRSQTGFTAAATTARNAEKSGAAADTRFKGLAPTLAAEERARPVSVKLAALHHPVRQRQLNAAAILAELGVGPGMTVVDIGAGGGLLSVPLARAVTPDGVVYATDVDERLVAALSARVAAEQLDALKPQFVVPEGDAFYASQRFDRVMMCSVFEYLRSPSDFFAALRPSLPTGARIAILQGRTGATYLPSDFDGPFALPVLRGDGESGPVWRRLPKALQARLSQAGAAKSLDEDDRAAMAQAFDAMLDDASLVMALAALADGRDAGDHGVGGARVTGALFAGLGVDDRALAAEIVALFQDEGLWAVDGSNVKANRDAAADNAVRTLNWLALLRYFPRSLPREVYPRGIYLTPAGIVRRLQAVGYRQLRLIDGLAAHDFVLLTTDDAPR